MYNIKKHIHLYKQNYTFIELRDVFSNVRYKVCLKSQRVKELGGI